LWDHNERLHETFFHFYQKWLINENIDKSWALFLILVPSQINKLPEMNNPKEATPVIAFEAIPKEATPAMAFTAFPDSNRDIEKGGRAAGLVDHRPGQVTTSCCCNTK
jgi:hypothetical protein